ncbi:inositol monophosphatase/fructose-1,6-bisphosphatase family protein [Bernardetia litoralis DSM 6794]|uniref:Inositol-1-monophosphatase n=1 Tax=Bernardetia litoralis (strain ATCC 23117 / DSM 6794 / NBRC 15988 / NCIMB 1366 / Fx l1 / Sio-4) TaxID=880071 RepID=I4APS6_BERLS|nr:inositol monophosphatase family protein [Bernardetia litoralis]AFM05961.1 inositol monophosphatase/fructose-1,6-bisphosphatase family protein [Bernardetia litoralis DSM 6794]
MISSPDSTFTNKTMLDLPFLRKEVSELSEKVAEFIYKEAQDFDKDDIEVKSFNSLVSYVDKEAEKKIVERLRELLPQAGIIAEEGTGTPKEEGFNWIIDPLDGTTNFVHGIPVYSISIALAFTEKKEGKTKTELLVGVVYEVSRKECFAAHQNGGATLNGKKITVSGENELGKSLIATGFPYEDFDRIEDYLFMMGKMMKAAHGLRRLGSAAVDLSYVAAGRFEGYFEYNLNSWDVAAGALLVKEAGGIVSDFEGNEIVENYIFGRQIIAATQIHSQILKLVKDVFLKK